MCPDGTQCRQGSPDAPDATRSGAWVQDAQDEQDAESRLGESGYNTTDQQKNLFLRVDRARFRKNSMRSLRPVFRDLPRLFCLSSLASGAPGRHTFPPQHPTRLLRPHPLLVPPPCIRPVNLSSTGLLPTPCSCAHPAAISATLPPLAT